MNQNSFEFLKNIPSKSSKEMFELVLKNKDIKIERIISYGQTSDKDFWYDQDEDEFVLVLEGNAKIRYDNGEIFELEKGSSLYIKAHTKHQVIYTANPTVWLAVFINS